MRLNKTCSYMRGLVEIISSAVNVRSVRQMNDHQLDGIPIEETIWHKPTAGLFKINFGGSFLEEISPRTG